MSPLRLLLSVLRRATQNMIVQRRLHLLAISVMALSLSVLGAFVLIASNLAHLREQLGADAKLTAFTSAQLDVSAGQKLSEQMRRLPGVDAVVYRSAEESAALFRQSLGAHGAVLDGLGPEVIPASIELTAAPGTTADGMAQIATAVEALTGVEEVAYAYAELHRLNAMIRIVEIAALAIGALIALVTIIVVSNTVRLTVVAREEEIDIMRLVGATDAFVQWPFVLEGAVAGLIAGGISVLIVAIIALALRSALAPIAQSAFSNFQLGSLTFEHAVFLTVSGTMLGLVGGLISVGRSLRGEG